MTTESFRITSIACRWKGSGEDFYDFTGSLEGVGAPEVFFVQEEEGQEPKPHGLVEFIDSEAGKRLASSGPEAEQDAELRLELKKTRPGKISVSKAPHGVPSYGVTPHVVTGPFETLKKTQPGLTAAPLYLLDLGESSIRGRGFDTDALGYDLE